MAPLNRFSLLVAASLLGGTAATAQTTNCQWFGAVWTCNTSPARAPLGNAFDHLRLPDSAAPARAFEDGLKRGQQMRIERERAELERQRLLAEREAFEAERSAAQRPTAPQIIVPQQSFVASLPERQQMGEMLKAGNCSGALNRALEMGDIQLATNIKGFCGGTAVQTAP